MSELTLPSPKGRIRHLTQEKAEVLELRTLLPKAFQVHLEDVDFHEPIASGSFGRVRSDMVDVLS